MAIKTVSCDVCGVVMGAKDAQRDIGNEQDLCPEHSVRRQIDTLWREKRDLAEKIEIMYGRRLRGLDDEIATLEAERVLRWPAEE